ncbi:molybdopterin molybdotransferase MoeA [Myxococcota bacterium]|nr:molybdopterin molybdotransferase MoeA [Myxococcota bacterium]MBU1533866.1 molybdopterin molybdotransferase MoeA [Myxococcota bacterium]
MYTPFVQAFEMMMTRMVPVVATETVSLAESVGRILADDVLTDRPVPPFDRVAMDGYALQRADLPGPITVLETVPAGSPPTQTVVPGTCSKVMTGCMLPAGADMVVQVELALPESQGSVAFVPAAASLKTANIAKVGEDAAQGQLFVEKHTPITPKITGILASVGIHAPRVFRRPVVAVVITGDEVVEPHQTPLLHQIRNANGVQLVTQLIEAGAVPRYYGITGDDPEALAAVFERAEAECDGILVSGGVSMGDFDFVPDILTSHGYEILFSKIAAKPGRPTTFAVSEGGWVFGMPGNPVTSFVVFEVMVKPFLLASMGAPLPLEVRMVLSRDISVKQSSRTTWLPCDVNGQGEVVPLDYHGSGHYHSLKNAWGLLHLEPGETNIPRGSHVLVRPL